MFRLFKKKLTIEGATGTLFISVKDESKDFFTSFTNVIDESNLKLNLDRKLGDTMNYYWLALSLGSNMMVIQNKHPKKYKIIHEALINNIKDLLNSNEDVCNDLIELTLSVYKNLKNSDNPLTVPIEFMYKYFPELQQEDNSPVLDQIILTYFTFYSEIWGKILNNFKVKV